MSNTPNMDPDKNMKDLIDLKRKWCVAIELGPTDPALLRFAHLVDERLQPREWALVHVVPEYDMIQFGYEDGSGIMELELGFREDSVKKLESLATDFLAEKPGRKVLTMIEAGEPEGQLLSDKYVAGANHLLIGRKDESTSSVDLIIRLTRNHRMPVWIVPEHAKAKLDRILVPVDFSPNSVRALVNAKHLIEQWNNPISLHVLHVYSPPGLSAAKLMRNKAYLQEEIREQKIEALGDLLHTYLGPSGTDVTIEAVPRDEPGIAQFIDEYARTVDADLVVMGAKGYSRIERLLMGSVTENWLRMNNHSITWIIK